MPLFKRKTFPLAELPNDLEPHELVYQVRFTEEIFRGYEYPFFSLESLWLFCLVFFLLFFVFCFLFGVWIFLSFSTLCVVSEAIEEEVMKINVDLLAFCL